MKVKKDTVIKDIKDSALIADYVSAGWEIVKENKDNEESNQFKPQGNKESK